MKQNIYDDLLKEMEEQGLENLDEALGCDTDIYDKIETDFYVTHKIKEE